MFRVGAMKVYLFAQKTLTEGLRVSRKCLFWCWVKWRRGDYLRMWPGGTCEVSPAPPEHMLGEGILGAEARGVGSVCGQWKAFGHAKKPHEMKMKTRLF